MGETGSEAKTASRELHRAIERLDHRVAHRLEAVDKAIEEIHELLAELPELRRQVELLAVSVESKLTLVRPGRDDETP